MTDIQGIIILTLSLAVIILVFLCIKLWQALREDRMSHRSIQPHVVPIYDREFQHGWRRPMTMPIREQKERPDDEGVRLVINIVPPNHPIKVTVQGKAAIGGTEDE